MIAALALLAAGLAGQASGQPSGEPELVCNGDGPQMQLNICSYQEFQRADAAMNVQWRTTTAVMRAQDRQIDRRYDRQPGYFDTLLAAQRAWITYRDQHCMSAGFEARGGSMAPLLVNTCMTELTNLRTQQLKSLVEAEN